MTSCNPTKYLTKDEILHVKNKIKVEQKLGEYETPVTEAEVKPIVRPKENKKFIGTHMPQYIYLAAIADKDTTKFDKFKMKSFGQAPILYDSLQVKRSKTSLKNYLFNHGYFKPEVFSATSIANQKSEVTYTLKPNQQYVYSKSEFMPNDTLKNYNEIIRQFNLENYSTTGKAYNVKDFLRLRSDMEEYAQNNGFYKFNKNAVTVEPDTIGLKNKAAIYYGIKKTAKDSLLTEKFYIRNVYVKIGQGLSDQYSEPEDYNERKFSHGEFSRVKPRILDRFILFKKGDLYSKKKLQNTIKKMYDLSIVSYANIDLVEVPRAKEQSDSLYLDAFISATAKKPIRLSVEPTLSEFQGPALSLDFSVEHRNIFKGAENLKFLFGGGFESAQRENEKTKLFGTQFFNAETRVEFPRLLLLDKIYPKTYESTTNQKSFIKASAQYENRIGLYNIINTNVSQTWDWQSNVNNRHVLSLIDVSSFTANNISPYYQSILDRYPSNAFNFQNRLIFASSYNYSYTNQLKRPNKSFHNFKGSFETAGQLAHLLSGKVNDTLKIGNNVVARYFRFVGDYKYNVPLKNEVLWVNRINVGMALPIGKVKSVPAIKQFYAGGANSMRAWRPRSLGPGAFRREITDPNALVDQRGDTKLELNTELRFPITKLFGQRLEGAAFTDVGNVWSLYENNEREEAQLTSKFYEQLAVGSGAGLRLKIRNFLNVRTDAAFKIHDPYRVEGDRWVPTPIDLPNMNLSLGIGYPF